MPTPSNMNVLVLLGLYFHQIEPHHVLQVYEVTDCIGPLCAMRGSGTSEGALPIRELFIEERWPSCFFKRCILFAYAPFGIIVLIFRLLIGLHVFVTACILRKTMLLRCTVLRVMSSILGVVVLSGGPAGGWDRKTPLIVANHLTVLDHMAVDLIEPCILPSVWNIPNLLRWFVTFFFLSHSLSIPFFKINK
uniref:PlsC domain-containing protein n=1 Tax=Ascaris lumbricoides TaxID=6252 RepID=A0A0M3IKR1_ASCLU